LWACSSGLALMVALWAGLQAVMAALDYPARSAAAALGS
jgi:hypothetical protein